jgi:hypothetical protein
MDTSDMLADAIERFLASSRVSTPRLQLAAARLAVALIPNAHCKLYEVAFAGAGGYAVNDALRGHDLTDVATGAHVEYKRSVVTRTRPRCNFNWCVPPDAPDRRARLLASVRAKVGGPGGHARLEVVDGTGRLLRAFVLRGDFLLAYFERAPLGRSGNHNMGCARCRRCGRFHRLERMQAASDAGLVDWTAVKDACGMV